jgi:hypothetical protein
METVGVFIAFTNRNLTFDEITSLKRGIFIVCR